jgi:hypothetical protein
MRSLISRTFLFALFLSLACAALPCLRQPTVRAADGFYGAWVNLSEGNDLSKYWTTTGNWKLEDNVIRLEPRPGEKGWERYDAYLWLTDKEYKDFQAEFDYKLDKGGNSGFYFHVGDRKSPVARGIEVQISDSAGDDNLTDHTSGGVIPGVPPSKNAAKPAGEWNHFSISCKSDKLSVVLNGQTVNEVGLKQKQLQDRPETGWVGFQDHGLPLRLRNVRIRPI